MMQVAPITTPVPLVDGEVLADGGFRVDVDARLRVGQLGHHSRYQRHAQFVEHVGQCDSW